jgi:hypothetical protein
MKELMMLLLLTTPAGRSLAAQSRYLDVAPRLIVSPVQHDSRSRGPFALRDFRFVQSPLGVGGDSVRSQHHYVRNGAMIGASIGFVAGAVGGLMGSDGCVNCSKARIASGYVLGFGAMSALAGAALGAITGQAIGWTRH